MIDSGEFGNTPFAQSLPYSAPRQDTLWWREALGAFAGRLLPLVLLVLAFVLFLAFLPSRGTVDTDIWMQWLHNADAYGPVNGFRMAAADYPPLTHVIFFLIAKLSHAISVNPFLTFKWSLVAALFLTVGIFYLWTRSLMATAALYFGLILSSVALAYLDIWVAPAFIAALWALQRKRLTAFTVLFAVASLIKWQPIIIAPFLFAYVLDVTKLTDFRTSWATSRKTLWLLLAIGAGVSLIFGVMDMILALGRALTDTGISSYALNLGWLATYSLHLFWPAKFGPLHAGAIDIIGTRSITEFILRKAVFGLAYLAVLVAFLKGRKTFENLMAFSLLGYLTYFMLCTGAHENHLFLACILAAILWRLNTDWMLTFAAWTTAANINLFLFYGTNGAAPPHPLLFGIDLTVYLAAVNVALYVLCCFKVFKKRLPKEAAPDSPALSRSCPAPS